MLKSELLKLLENLKDDDNIIIDFSVASAWIEDGFNLLDSHWIQKITDFFKGLLPFAYDHETIVKINIQKVQKESNNE